ncbi:hypothetical protein AB6N24_00005 [Cellulomonas sp. 179-A 4D5 NHS]|uniref:hypothetical protein n=1 Tax=Cellulomonas sp. 179-A 4D5 NHS TaxID=3142378 RepID=UPI0039A18B6B
MAARPDDPDDTVPDPGTTPGTAEGTGGATPEPVPDAPREPTDDERWAAIVADLTGGNDPVGGTSGPTSTTGTAAGPAVTYPVAPGVPDPRVIRPAADDAEHERHEPPELTGRSWDGTTQMDAADAADEAEEHFVAPDPGPVMGGDPLLTMAWFAAAGMPIFLLVVVVAWPTAPAAIIQAATAVFVLGVAALLWRMPHRRDDADDDTGAVV